VSAPSVVVPSVRTIPLWGIFPRVTVTRRRHPYVTNAPGCRGAEVAAGRQSQRRRRVARLNPAGDWVASCGLCLLASLVPELDDTVAPSLHYALSGRLRSLIFLEISWHVVQIGLNDRDNRAGPTGASRVIKSLSAPCTREFRVSTSSGPADTFPALMHEVRNERSDAQAMRRLSS